MLKFLHRDRTSVSIFATAALICSVALSTSAGAPRSASSRFLGLKKGDAASGKQVFRFETFGNERFWTDAARMPQGMKAARITPLDALKVGLSVDSDMLDAATREEIVRELATDLSPTNAPMLNDPAVTEKLVGANAVIGVVARRGKVGITCTICHAMTDGSVVSLPNGGGIGRRRDGLTQHNLNVGKLLAVCGNSRAFFPILQIERNGKSIGRAPVGLTKNSTEAEVDAYLSNPKYYPVGTFDDTPDGIGNSVHITPLFRQDLAAPFGSSGQNATVDDFSNTVYTVLFDQTTLVTPGGRAFLKVLGGAAGVQLSKDYAEVLRDTGVRGYPYVNAAHAGPAGRARTPVGLRVDNQKLLDMNAYLASLPAPRGTGGDRGSIARGRQFFMANCTSCHGADQSKAVAPILVPMKRIFPGYSPMILARRMPPLSPIQNSPGTFDDKMIVVDASPAGKIRGNALPLLLDLGRSPIFLHDASVHSLNGLLDPSRGRSAPHPFYVGNLGRRGDVVNYLRSLDTR